jgi:hypothetical protein
MAKLTPPPQTSAHWYTAAGKAQHHVPLADGSGQRDTTLTDARQLGLFPSVSAILGLLGKPGLERWKQRKVAEAAITLKRQKKEGDDYFIKRILALADTPARQAADLGRDLHSEIERFFRSLTTKEPFSANPKLAPFAGPTINWILAKGYVVTHPEATLVNPAHGFGGTMDFPFTWRNGQGIGVLDFKSRKTEPGVAIEPYPQQPLQIAAYAATYWGEDRLPQCWGANLYISTTEPGRTELVSYDPAVLSDCWMDFLYLCHLWRRFNRYDPRCPAGEQPAFATGKTIVIAAPGGELIPSGTASPEPGAKIIAAAVDRRETTFLSLLQEATLNDAADGLDFLKPADCCAMASGASPPKTDYAWWYHAETNAGCIGLRGDAALREQGWREAFLAWPKQLAQLPAAAGAKAARAARPTPAKGALKAPAGRTLTPAQSRKRGDELGAKVVINFGRFKGQRLGDVPADYLDWLRGQPQTLAVYQDLREYLSLDHVNQRIDRALKRAGKG